MKDFPDPETGETDKNQNLVFNVSKALNNVGYLNYWKDMGLLLLKKKKKDKMMKEAKEKLEALAKDGKSLGNEGKKLQDKIDLLGDSIKVLQNQAKDLLKAEKEYMNENKPMCVYSYIQFQSMNGKEKFMKAMNIGCCKRNLMICRGEKDEIDHKYLGGRWPTVQDSTHPSLILWQNLGYGAIDRCLTSFYVGFVTLILMSIGFGIIISLILYKDSYATSTATDCGNVNYTRAMAIDDYLNEGFDSYILQCFCLNQYSENPLDIFNVKFQVDGEEISACKGWISNYITRNSLLYGISAIISTINAILRVFLRELSKKEGKHTETIRLQSAASKMWIV